MKSSMKKPGILSKRNEKRLERIASSNVMDPNGSGSSGLPGDGTLEASHVVQISEKILDEDITGVITGNNPQVPHGVVMYSFPDKEYKPVPGATDEHTYFHVRINGSAMHIDSEENTEQRNWERNFRALVDDRRRARYIAAQEAGKDLSAAELEDDTQRNQFNYTERAVQTFNTLIKTRIMGTTPPETTNQCGSVSQWQIYDAYKAELKQLQLSTDMEKASREAKASRESEANADEKSKGATKSTNPVHSEEMGEKLAILERIAVQNAEDDTYSDFRYYESPADPFVSTGSALPLWQFADPRTRRKQVTAITWNPVHQDLFAVAYGSYDFMRQGSGMIACYTLKNVGHPEYSFQCESGVMSLAFHPTIPSLLAAGCYDGSVRVYDIRKREARPVFECDGRFGKHSDPVWGVYWEPSSSDRNPTFYSISGDGHVGAWSLQKRELHMEVVMTLKLGHGPAPGTTSDTPNPAPSPAMAAGSAVAAVAALQQTSAVAGGGDSPPLGESLKNGTTTLAKFGELTDINNATGLAGGSCFDFSPFHPNIYLVGTEEGAIHTCNLETTGQYIASYIGHSMAVYSVRWNVFHPRIFMSCSADWTIKIWDTTRVNAVMSIDMGTAVGDCAWAPYSSTVFAAVTDHGRLNVWDLNANKHDFICDQPLDEEGGKCTKIVFNPSAPIILVGFANGKTMSYKLSPNLRRVTALPLATVPRSVPIPVPPPEVREEIEIRKFDKLLAASDAKITIVTPLPSKSFANKKREEASVAANADTEDEDE